MTAPTAEQTEPLPRPRLRRAGWLHELAETLLIFVIVYALVNLLSARFVVEGSSMVPSFSSGQYILVNRVTYLMGKPQRGDVIVLHSPENAETDLIKRLIGLPGETVSIMDGVVAINGVPLHEPYINGPPPYQGEWTLEADEYFVLGDNRINSHDSHNFGPVKRTSLVGQATLIYWPVSDWQIVTHFDYTTPVTSLPGG